LVHCTAEDILENDSSCDEDFVKIISSSSIEGGEPVGYVDMSVRSVLSNGLKRVHNLVGSLWSSVQKGQPESKKGCLYKRVFETTNIDHTECEKQLSDDQELSLGSLEISG